MGTAPLHRHCAIFTLVSKEGRNKASKTLATGHKKHARTYRRIAALAAQAAVGAGFALVRRRDTWIAAHEVTRPFRRRARRACLARCVDCLGPLRLEQVPGLRDRRAYRQEQREVPKHHLDRLLPLYLAGIGRLAAQPAHRRAGPDDSTCSNCM